MKVKSALIIGCGKMGCFFDEPNSSDIISHAHALNNLGYELSFYDIAPENSAKAAKMWSGNIASLTDQKRYDVGVVAISTIAHFDILFKLNPEHFGSLVVEKPFCQTRELAQEILQKFNQKNVFVNYSRLYLKEYQNLKLQIRNNVFGECSRFTGQYSKGFLNNGSHLLSLLKFLLDFKDLKVQSNNQFTEKLSGLVNHDLYLKNESLGGSIIGLDDSNYSFWEISLFFQKAVIKITDFGQSIEISGLQKEHIRINYNNALMNLYKKIEDEDDAFALETNGNALFVHEVMKNILGEK